MIGVVLNERRETIAEALHDVAALAETAMTNLRDAGFADVDLPTRNLSVRDWFDPQTQQPTARSASYQFALVVRDLSDVARAVDLLASSAGDALEIQGIAFAHSDPVPLAAAARRDAVRDAQARAEQLAAAAGVHLGPIRSIHEGVTAVSPIGMRMAGAAPREVSAPINPGNQPVSVRVTVTFALDGP